MAKIYIKKSNISSIRKISNVVVGSIFLMAGIQVAKAEVCAPDIKYLLPQITTPTVIDSINGVIVEEIIHGLGYAKAIEHYEENISRLKEGLRERQEVYWEEDIKFSEEMIKQIKCRSSGGKVAATSADFDVNGNYTGSIQQASNKKSSKGNDQEQVASSDSNSTNSNSSDSNKADSKKSLKRKIYPGANKCIKIDRDSNNLTAFVENHCNFPIRGEMADEGDCKPDKYGEYYCAIGTPYIKAGQKESVGIIKGKAIFAMCPYPSWPTSKTFATKTGEKLKVGEKYACKEL